MVSGFEDEQIELTGIPIWWTTGYSYHIVRGKSAIKENLSRNIMSGCAMSGVSGPNNIAL